MKINSVQCSQGQSLQLPAWWGEADYDFLCQQDSIHTDNFGPVPRVAEINQDVFVGQAFLSVWYYAGRCIVHLLS